MNENPTRDSVGFAKRGSMGNKLKIVAYKMPPQENWNAFRDETQQNPN